ncbi:hypothetical protein KP509_32G017800 [Ceratopteris richardii]|nr:hypothetical protein KP509_32G017800 [Ceratopteris richardii]
MKKEDVKVLVVGGDTLQVSGTRKSSIERAYGKYHIKERPSGTFFRSFQLPGEVKENEITAVDEYGVLVVHVPKKKRLIRRIPISML